MELGGTDAAVGTALTGRLAELRQQLVDRIIRAAALLSLIYLPVVLWRAASVGWHRQLATQAGIALAVLSLVPLLKRIPLAWKSAILVGVSMMLGLAGVFTLGMMGAGYWWCLQAAMLAATLYSTRTGIVVTLLSVSLIAASGLGFVTGRITPPFDLNAHLANPSAWVAFLVVILFVSLVFVFYIGRHQALIQLLAAETDAQRRELATLVHFDQLTGLPLMRLARDRLEMAVKQAQRAGLKGALLFVDLDGFKAVNDSHGHQAGDHLLSIVAERMLKVVRDEDTVARIGGDEFLLILNKLRDAGAAEKIAQKVLNELALPVSWMGQELRVGASVGIALFPEHSDEVETLLRMADAAMYQVKKSGKNRYRLAVTEMASPI